MVVMRRRWDLCSVWDVMRDLGSACVRGVG